MRKLLSILLMLCLAPCAFGQLVIRGRGYAVEAAATGWNNTNTPLVWYPFPDTNLLSFGSLSITGFALPSPAAGPTFTSNGLNVISGSPHENRIEYGYVGDGSDDWIKFLSSPFEEDSSTSFTWMAWIRADTDDFNAGVQLIYDTDGAAAASANGMFIALDDRNGAGQAENGIVWGFGCVGDTGDQNCVLDNVFSATPTWVHVAIAYSSALADGMMWTNGVSVAPVRTGTASGNFVPTVPFAAGLLALRDGSLNMKGQVAHMKCYNFALSNAQVSNEWWFTGGRGTPVTNYKDENGYP